MVARHEYISSYKKGYISFNIYDANIAIANGNKPIVIAGSIITFALLIYLMILNKHQKRLYLRIGLLIIMFAMIQAIIWLNPLETTSIVLGGICLAAMRMFVIMTCITMIPGASRQLKWLLIGIIILAAIGVVLQIVFAYAAANIYQTIHPELENYVILLFLVSIMILGLY